MGILVKSGGLSVAADGTRAVPRCRAVAIAGLGLGALRPSFPTPYRVGKNCIKVVQRAGSRGGKGSFWSHGEVYKQIFKALRSLLLDSNASGVTEPKAERYLAAAWAANESGYQQ